MEAYVSAVPAYEEVVRLMKVEFTEKVTGKVRCRSRYEASSLAKGYDSGPPSLHPWRI